MRWLDGTIASTDMSLSILWETVKDREAWRAAVHGITKSDMTDRLNKVTIYRYTHTYTHTHTHIELIHFAI